MIFKDRTQAGKLLAGQLTGPDPKTSIVVALPRGGLPVAAEIAKAFDLPLDVLLVRKIGAPGQSELAIGAVTDGANMHVTVNRDIMDVLGINEESVRALAQKEMPELERRKELYGAGDGRSFEGKTIILVDDGVATGATARLALQSIRECGAQRIILALPVAPIETLEVLSEEVDEVVCLQRPRPFYSVGAHYFNFDQVSDKEAIQILADAKDRLV